MNAIARPEPISAQRYQVILDSVLDAVVTVDGTGRIVETNAPTATMFGHAQTDLIGRMVDHLFAEDHRAPRTKLLNSCIRIQNGRLEHCYVESEGQRASGDRFPMELTVSPTELCGETCFLYIFRDISRRREDQKRQKELESSLRDAQKLEAIAHLAGGVAHEINTPSQYIQDNLAFLDDGFRDLIGVLESAIELIETHRDQLPTDKISELHARIKATDLADLIADVPDAIGQSRSGIGHIARIVSSLRETAHPSGSKAAGVSVARLVENAVTMTGNQWKYLGDLEADLAADLPPLTANAGELTQVLINLIVNSCHAVEEAGVGSARIRITATRDGDGVAVTVADNGPGIPAGLRDSIFNPFFTTKEVGKGTGQGLAICKDVVVKRHGGRLDLAESSLGGAAFKIWVPVEAA